MTAVWTLALLAGVLWPGRVLSPLDGIPLNGHLEAILIGVVLPVLWWLDRGFLSRRPVQVAILALLSLKLVGSLALPQHGLCARFSTTAPFRGVSSTIPINEPTGSLRSWDLRADWRMAAPRCTAILERSYESQSEFPVWFVNLLNFIRPGRSDLRLDVTGHVSVSDSGSFALEIGPDMEVTGQVGAATVGPQRGGTIVVPLATGSHMINLHINLEASLSGEHWRLVPLWNGRDAWTSTRLTASPSSRLDAALSRPLAIATAAIVLLLMVAWSKSAVAALDPSRGMAVWMVIMATLLACLGVQGRFDRLAGPLLLASAVVPLATRHRNLRGAFALVGVPWLALFIGRSWTQIGQVTAYSFDDWHIFQSAAYRIFLNGYWLEGGSATFYFQPLYRWIAGALHLVFGDSSVGEVYWDAACLLSAALTSFAVVKLAAGFRWAVAAAAMTLATFTMGTIWHVIGRGLSEITAAGWMSLAAMFLLRARLGRTSAAFTAGVFAVLMWYTRLNHLLFAGFLSALLLSMRAEARCGKTPGMPSDGWPAVRRATMRCAAMYAATIAAGVTLFAARTWWYTGRFSLFYGTSFPMQETGLRLTTIGSPAVWRRVGESLSALVWMNEPPSPDPRATLVVLGVLLSLLALIQIPYVNRLPLPVAVVTVGAMAGSIFAHAHAYPGRMSVHLVPFAVGMTMCAASRLGAVLIDGAE